MDLYIYADESGTFDKNHNEIFVFGGVIFLGKQARDIAIREYNHVERVIRQNSNYMKSQELKACVISNKDKGKIFRSLNKQIRFGVVVHQRQLMDRIFDTKKDKQRYLDYAFKIGIKKCLNTLIAEDKLSPINIDTIYVFMDEHTTATNGRYELREGLEQEFKNGTFNMQYDKFFPPLFPSLSGVDLQFCNSSKKVLIRAADIVANRIYKDAISNNLNELTNKVYLHSLP